MLPTGATKDQSLSSGHIDQTTLLKALKALKAELNSELRMALGDEIEDIQQDLVAIHEQMNQIDKDVIDNKMTITTLDSVVH